jgi:hypothetical protein
VAPSSPPTLTVAPTPPWPWPSPHLASCGPPGHACLPALTRALVTTRPHRRAHPVLSCPHARNTDVVTTTPRRSHRPITASSSSPPALTVMPTSRTSRPSPRLTLPSLPRPPAHNTDVVAVTTHPHRHIHLLAPILTPPRPLWSTRNACPTRARNTSASIHIRKLPNMVVSRHI